jgi:hypothetical protein
VAKLSVRSDYRKSERLAWVDPSRAVQSFEYLADHERSLASLIPFKTFVDFGDAGCDSGVARPKRRFAGQPSTNFFFWIQFPAPLGQRYLFNVIIDVPMFHRFARVTAPMRGRPASARAVAR